MLVCTKPRAATGDDASLGATATGTTAAVTVALTRRSKGKSPRQHVVESRGEGATLTTGWSPTVALDVIGVAATGLSRCHRRHDEVGVAVPADGRRRRHCHSHTKGPTRSDTAATANSCSSAGTKIGTFTVGSSTGTCNTTSGVCWPHTTRSDTESSRRHSRPVIWRPRHDALAAARCSECRGVRRQQRGSVADTAAGGRRPWYCQATILTRQCARLWRPSLRGRLRVERARHTFQRQYRHLERPPRRSRHLFLHVTVTYPRQRLLTNTSPNAVTQRVVQATEPGSHARLRRPNR